MQALSACRSGHHTRAATPSMATALAAPLLPLPLLLLLLLLAGTGTAAASVSSSDRTALDPRVEPLLAKMTLAEKAGQLGVFSRPAGSDFNPGTGGGWNATLDFLRNGSIGALYNGQGVAINKELQRVAVEESRLGIPLIFGADVWHGMWTVFPMPLGEAASWEPALARSTARATAVEATASGIFWTYSPMVSLSSSLCWLRLSPLHIEAPLLSAVWHGSRWTWPVTSAGDVSRREQEKTHSSAPRSRAPALRGSRATVASLRTTA